jgi:hypothetical protein
MGHLEETVLNKEIRAPNLYDRWVDDIFIDAENEAYVIELKNKFETNSCLKFTYEIEKHRALNFLDVKIYRNEASYSTKVYIKDTNNGDCLNFQSICPLRYKEGVIKTFLHRAYTVCSDWKSLDQEINRIKQMLVNNNFPISLIDKEIKNFMNGKFKKEKQEQKDKIKIYFKGQMTSQYKQQEDQLKSIVKKNIVSNKIIIPTIYYKNKKLKNLLIRNQPTLDIDAVGLSKSNVIYEFTCPEVECNVNNKKVTYIGYTTNRLQQRLTQHYYSGAIRTHGQDYHNKRFSKQDMFGNTKSIANESCLNDLRILEALYIKERRPPINLKDEGITRTLFIF